MDGDHRCEEQIEPARPEERLLALPLAFSDLTPSLARQREEEVVAAAAADENVWKGLWVMRRNNQLVAVQWHQVLPGRIASIVAPQLIAGQPESSSRRLYAAVERDLARQGVRLVQALMETDQGGAARRLRDAGFEHAADLLYLVSLSESFPHAPSAEPLEYEPFAENQRDRLAAVVEATYEGTRDCPRLNGVRSTLDILAGYQAQGRFDPRCWSIVRHQGHDVGCLLLTEHSAERIWELVYMGLIQAARGQGWGIGITRHAQWLCGQAGASRLVLAVDAANEPAIAMYAAAGFAAWDRRSVFLRVLS